ncbi:MAG: DUF2635 domain-containing protein [Enterobacteriaceae bacterium]
MFLKPAPGCAVRDPVKGSLLPESGAEVPDSYFWRRRLQDGDVVEATAEAAKAAPKSGDKA